MYRLLLTMSLILIWHLPVYSGQKSESEIEEVEIYEKKVDVESQSVAEASKEDVGAESFVEISEGEIESESVVEISEEGEVDSVSAVQVSREKIDPPPVIQVPQTEEEILKQVFSKLGLSDQQIEDRVIFESQKVVWLDLSNPDLGKPGFEHFPVQVLRLSALKVLVLKNNTISSIPDEIRFLSELRELDMSSNRLVSIPASIGQLRRLEKLDLRFNRLTDLPAEFANLSNLTVLQLWGNRFTTLPVSVTRLRSLRELYLKQNQLTTLPASVTNMRLKYIDVHMNRLCDLPANIDKWITTLDKRYREHQRCW